MWPDIDAWSIVRLISFRKGLLFRKDLQGYQMDFFVTVQKIKHSTALSLLCTKSEIGEWHLLLVIENITFLSKVFWFCIGKHGTIQCLLKIDFKLLPLCWVIYFLSILDESVQEDFPLRRAVGSNVANKTWLNRKVQMNATLNESEEVWSNGEENCWISRSFLALQSLIL